MNAEAGNLDMEVGNGRGGEGIGMALLLQRYGLCVCGLGE